MRFTPILLIFVFASAYSQQQAYTFVFLHKKDSVEVLPKEQVAKIMESHMANINRLAEEGKLLVAGPFEGGGGIFILNTTSVSKAREWLSTDPGVQAKRWDIEILSYVPRSGSVCVVKEPYDMVSYYFVRFKNSKTSTSQYETQLQKEHNDYKNDLLNKETLVTTGLVGNSDNIFVFKNDPKEDISAMDIYGDGRPVTVEFKKLWIAKGSFCEK